jgi:hypothetical protein
MMKSLFLLTTTVFMMACSGTPQPQVGETASAIKPPPFVCADDADCGPGQVCYFPRCARNAPSCEPSCQPGPQTGCQSNADCGKGEICVTPPCSPQATRCPNFCQMR